MKNVVVIDAENRSFDNMFDNFPNANGIPTSGIVKQKDRDVANTELPSCPSLGAVRIVAGDWYYDRGHE